MDAQSTVSATDVKLYSNMMANDGEQSTEQTIVEFYSR